MEKLNISYACGVSDRPLLGITIGEIFDRIAVRYGDNDALISRHQDIRYSYSELKEKVDECARSLSTLGLKKSDRIGIWSNNRAEWLITQLASAKLGAILVNINPAYRLHELEFALKQSACKFIVIEDRFKYSDYTGMMYDVVPELKESEPGKLDSKTLPELTAVIRIHPEPSPGMLTWKQMLGFADGKSAAQLSKFQEGLSFDDPINIQYTSGTTGMPKGATLSHHNILNNGFMVAENMELTDRDRLVLPVPLYHCFGMVLGNLGAITHGATLIYPGEGFDAGSVLKAVHEEKATVLFGVPTMFIAELEHPDFKEFDLESLRTGIMAGALCPVEVMKKVNTLMHMEKVEIAYGMTETSPVSTQTRADAPFEKRVSTVGKVLPHTEVKIVDPETNRVVAIGETGELCTRGYCVMLGYWNDEEKTRETIDEARWLHTGDLATMDEEGYISIVGRIKDMVIRGGENIYPREIEEYLYGNPKIAAVQVIGVPDEKFGEELMAWIRLHEGTVADADEIRDFCKGNIAHYKIPRYIKFTDEFPMTVTGKVRKVEMRE
ncbi:MAG: AMP-binding protein, partial [Acidobacteriota bacterium]|nr:AMP-binding protein [Acidobacteriota bacterium]